MKTLRELLDNREHLKATKPNDEMVKRMDDMFVIYVYMTQKDIDIDNAESVSKIILNSLQQARLIKDHFDSIKDSVDQ